MNVSGLGSGVSRLMAETAVENTETNRLIRKAGYQQSQASLNMRNTERQLKNDVQSVQSFVQTAQSAASAVQSGVKGAQQVADAQAFSEVQPELSSGAEAARDGGSVEGILEVRLGEEGPTVAERFGEEGVNQLMRSDLGVRDGETRGQWDARVGADLADAGFTDREVDQLHRLGQDGELSTDEVAGFLWANREDPAAGAASEQRQRLVSELTGKASEWFGFGADQMARHHDHNAEALDEVADDVRAIATEAHQQAVELNRQIGELSLRSLRERLGQTADQRR